jgi:serine/threonine protein kinase/tetratricopeptide (TPR) repeat protein
VGPYEVVAPLGAGGMAEVYLARDTRLGRDIALKVVNESLAGSPELVRRFEQEARLAGSLNHPNVVAVYDVGIHEGAPFFVTELLHGESLRQRLSTGRIPLETALDWAAQMAQGLAAAHASGIVHRDVKPDNVFVGSDGRVKLLDFGIAKLTQAAPEVGPHGLLDDTVTPAASGTRTGSVLGTPGYMSPEQVRGESVDARTDIFGLGAVIYELLSGRRAFPGATLAETAAAILHDEPRPLAPEVPEAVAQIVLRCLDKEPGHRPQSAGELASALEALRSPADPPGHPPANRHRKVRPRWLVGAAAGGGIAAVAALLVLSGTHRAEADRSIAVLPFASLNPGEEASLFADGIHAELLTQLSHVVDLKVISRQSVLGYRDGTRNLREIGAALGVASVLEGSVQRAGNRVRIEARLSDVRTDRQMWAERYDRDLTDVFAIQTAVTEEIARALRARLSAAEKSRIERRPTRNPEALEFVVRGQEYEGRPNPEPRHFLIAEDLYRRAIALDPDYALAHAQLSYLETGKIYWYQVDATEARLADARKEAERAMALDPTLPESHVAMGYLPYAKRDYRAAIGWFRRALALDANNVTALTTLGYAERRLGEFDSYLKHARRLTELDPRSVVWPEDMAYTLTLLRRYDEATRLFDSVLARAPDDVPARVDKARLVLIWKGDARLARALLAELPAGIEGQGNFTLNKHLLDLMKVYPRDAVARLAPTSYEFFSARIGAYPRDFIEALAAAEAGDAAGAEARYDSARRQLEPRVQANPGDWRLHVAMGRVNAGLGRRADAIREARTAVDLLPISDDAVDGPFVLEELAAVHAQVGERAEAIQILDRLLSSPGFLSPPLLRIDHKWDPLRGEPRFRKLAGLE